MAQEIKTQILEGRYLLGGDDVARYENGQVAVCMDIITHKQFKVIQKDGVAYVGKLENLTQNFVVAYGCNVLHTLSNNYLGITQSEQKEIISIIKKCTKENGFYSCSYTCLRSSGAKSDETKLNSKGETIKKTLTKEEQKAQGLLNEIVVLVEYHGELNDTRNLYNGASEKWVYKVIQQNVNSTFEIACKLADMK